MNTRIKCLIVDDEPLAREIIENYISRIDHLELIASCANALEAFNIIADKSIDLIFLDIQMPDLTGIDFLKDLNPSPKVIFTTAYSNYAVDAFNLEAIDYLLKPIEFSRFLKSVNKVLKLYKSTSALLELSNSNEAETNYQDLFIYLKVEKKMQKIFLISNIESVLPSTHFLRVHRSFIIGIDHIDAFSTIEIELKGIKIPVGRNYKASVKEKLGYF